MEINLFKINMNQYASQFKSSKVKKAQTMRGGGPRKHRTFGTKLLFLPSTTGCNSTIPSKKFKEVERSSREFQEHVFV
jgi:hypothetical protein